MKYENKAGIDYTGIGVGAMIFNAQGQVFMARRGHMARNEQGKWEFPGGGVEFNELLSEAIVREIYEETELVIETEYQLGTYDHILLDEKQHWVCVTFVCKHLSGEAKILEADKCSQIGWFSIDALPNDLTKVSAKNIVDY